MFYRRDNSFFIKLSGYVSLTDFKVTDRGNFEPATPTISFKFGTKARTAKNNEFFIYENILYFRYEDNTYNCCTGTIDRWNFGVVCNIDFITALRVSVASIPTGSTFKYQGKDFIKTDRATVNLKTGQTTVFDSDFLVCRTNLRLLEV